MDTGCFGQSTHARHWLFTATQLDELRQATRRSAIERYRERTNTVTSDTDFTFTPSQESLLYNYYSQKIAEVCEHFRFPHKVFGTAVAYFKRFFIHHSPIDFSYRSVMITSVYLANKVEEIRVPIREFARKLSVDEGVLSHTESVLLHGLSFHLRVYHPFLPILGVVERIKGTELAPAENIQKIMESATSLARTALFTDAPFLYPPSQIALACISLALAGDSDLSTISARLIEILSAQKFITQADESKIETLLQRVLAIASEVKEQRAGTPPAGKAVRLAERALARVVDRANDPQTDEFRAKLQQESEKAAARHAVKRQQSAEEEPELALSPRKKVRVS